MQAVCDLLQYEVALVVAERVVDLLESVKVEREHRHALTTRPARGGDRHVEGLLQGLAVAHAGEVVQARGRAQGALLATQRHQRDDDQQQAQRGGGQARPGGQQAGARGGPFRDVPVVGVAGGPVDAVQDHSVTVDVRGTGR